MIKTTMMRAQHMLESLLKRPDPGPSRAVLQHELNFIRIRTEPTQRVAEICSALAGRGPDPELPPGFSPILAGPWGKNLKTRRHSTSP